MVSGPVWLSLHRSVPLVALLKSKQLGALPPSQLGLGGSAKGSLAHSSRAVLRVSVASPCGGWVCGHCSHKTLQPCPGPSSWPSRDPSDVHLGSPHLITPAMLKAIPDPVPRPAGDDGHPPWTAATGEGRLQAKDSHPHRHPLPGHRHKPGRASTARPGRRDLSRDPAQITQLWPARPPEDGHSRCQHSHTHETAPPSRPSPAPRPQPLPSCCAAALPSRRPCRLPPARLCSQWVPESKHGVTAPSTP